MEYCTRHLYFLVYTRAFKASVYTKKIQVTSGIFHGHTMHRKYSGQMGRLSVIQLNITDRWEGSVEWWRIHNGFPAIWLAVFCTALYKLRCTHSFASFSGLAHRASCSILTLKERSAFNLIKNSNEHLSCLSRNKVLYNFHFLKHFGSRIINNNSNKFRAHSFY